ncbi:MAG: hypothetical protein KBC57_05535 [Neisseriaceae bacterium]|nr:hypothetical protein [Neisseriaceae bacterium]
MHQNWHITPITLIAVAAGFLCALLGHFLPFNDGLAVYTIEQIQALWLLFCSLYFSQQFLKARPNKQNHYAVAWFAAMWWLLLGRSMAWGRDYFPELPHHYFRPIAIVLIAAPLVLLCLPQTRQQLKRLIQRFHWPMWVCLAIFCFFVVSQVVESERMFQRLPPFINPDRRDLIEELFEMPFMMLLFWVNRQCYLQDATLKNTQASAQHFWVKH